MLALITNKKNNTYFIKQFNYVGVNNPSDFIVNNLDLSFEWTYKEFSPFNKGDLIKYIILKDTTIKDIDTAINCNYTQLLREVEIDYSYFATIYFKDGQIKVLSLLELFAKLYFKRL